MRRSILDSTHIVTAAHCVVDDGGFYPRVRPPAEIEAFHGAVEFAALLEAPPVTTVSVDRRYLRSPSEAFDSAVLTLAVPLALGTNTNASPLADQSEVEDALDGTPEATISGWGVVNPNTGAVSNTLQKATVPLVTDASCRGWFPELVDSVMLGAGSRAPFPSPCSEDACQGDSGGPLALSGKLAGIVSFGIDCGRFPGVYTEINDRETRDLLDDDSQAAPPAASGGPTFSGRPQVGRTLTCNARPQGTATATQYKWFVDSRSSANQIATARTITVPAFTQGRRLFCDARLEGAESGFLYSQAAQVSGPIAAFGDGVGAETAVGGPAASTPGATQPRLLSDTGFGGFPGRMTSLRRVLRRGPAGRRTARKLRRLTRGTAIEVRVTASDSRGTRRVEKKRLRLRR